MAEESEEVLQQAVIWLQEKQEELREGFDVEYNGSEYTFFAIFKER